MSIYKVTGRTAYREHEPGSSFEAVLEPAAERRAIARGSIALLQRSEPRIQPGSWQPPAGWANQPPKEHHNG